VNGNVVPAVVTSWPDSCVPTAAVMLPHVAVIVVGALLIGTEVGLGEPHCTPFRYTALIPTLLTGPGLTTVIFKVPEVPLV